MIHSLVPPAQTFTARTCHATSTELKQNHFVHSKYKKKYSQTVSMWNRLPRGCFSEHVNLDLLKPKVNRYLSLLSQYSFINTIICTHITHLITDILTVTLSLEWLSILVLGKKKRICMKKEFVWICWKFLNLTSFIKSVFQWLNIGIPIFWQWIGPRTFQHSVLGK